MDGIRKMKSKVFICFGLFCLTCSIGLTGYNLYENHCASKNAAAVIRKLSETIEDIHIDVTPKQMQTVNINGYEYIGTLNISLLDLKTPILSETTSQLLDVAPCCYSGSFLEDNLVIGGHNYRSLFGKLHHSEVGMEVNFYDVYDKCYTYQIAKIEILNPNSIDDLIHSQYDLSIYTCTNDGRNRIVVRCLKMN